MQACCKFSRIAKGVTFLAARDVVEGLSVFEHAYADVGQHFNGIVGLVCAGSFVFRVPS